MESAVDDAKAHIAAVLSEAQDATTALDRYVYGSVLALADDQLAIGAGGAMSPEAEERALEILERFHSHLNRILHRESPTDPFVPTSTPIRVRRCCST